MNKRVIGFSLIFLGVILLLINPIYTITGNVVLESALGFGVWLYIFAVGVIFGGIVLVFGDILEDIVKTDFFKKKKEDKVIHGYAEKNAIAYETYLRKNKLIPEEYSATEQKRLEYARDLLILQGEHEEPVSIHKPVKPLILEMYEQRNYLETNTRRLMKAVHEICKKKNYTLDNRKEGIVVFLPNGNPLTTIPNHKELSRGVVRNIYDSLLSGKPTY